MQDAPKRLSLKAGGNSPTLPLPPALPPFKSLRKNAFPREPSPSSRRCVPNTRSSTGDHYVGSVRPWRPHHSGPRHLGHRFDHQLPVRPPARKCSGPCWFCFCRSWASSSGWSRVRAAGLRWPKPYSMTFALQTTSGRTFGCGLFVACRRCARHGPAPAP